MSLQHLPAVHEEERGRAKFRDGSEARKLPMRSSSAFWPPQETDCRS